MTAFILWFASFISSPGAATSLQSSSPSVISLATTGNCPPQGCGLNGTRITGLSLDVTGEIRSVTLPSGERVTLR